MALESAVINKWAVAASTFEADPHFIMDFEVHIGLKVLFAKGTGSHRGTV